MDLVALGVAVVGETHQVLALREGEAVESAWGHPPVCAWVAQGRGEGGPGGGEGVLELVEGEEVAREELVGLRWAEAVVPGAKDEAVRELGTWGGQEGAEQKGCGGREVGRVRRRVVCEERAVEFLLGVGGYLPAPRPIPSPEPRRDPGTGPSRGRPRVRPRDGRRAEVVEHGSTSSETAGTPLAWEAAAREASGWAKERVCAACETDPGFGGGNRPPPSESRIVGLLEPS